MKQKTNKQLVKKIMDTSQYGKLSEMFVMQALHSYSKAIIASNADEYKNSFINPEAWLGVAKEISEQLNNRD